MPHPRDLVRKSEFAEMRGVSPARVSQWIAEGKIGRDAIVGDGQRALINSPLAVKQLHERRDRLPVFEKVRAELLRWPSRVSPEIAAKLQVDQTILENLLTLHLEACFQLTESDVDQICVPPKASTLWSMPRSLLEEIPNHG